MNYDKRTDEWMGERTGERADGRTGEQMGERTDGLARHCLEGWLTKHWNIEEPAAMKRRREEYNVADDDFLSIVRRFSEHPRTAVYGGARPSSVVCKVVFEAHNGACTVNCGNQSEATCDRLDCCFQRLPDGGFTCHYSDRIAFDPKCSNVLPTSPTSTTTRVSSRGQLPSSATCMDVLQAADGGCTVDCGDQSRRRCERLRCCFLKGLDGGYACFYGDRVQPGDKCANVLAKPVSTPSITTSTTSTTTPTTTTTTSTTTSTTTPTTTTPAITTSTMTPTTTTRTTTTPTTTTTKGIPVVSPFPWPPGVSACTNDHARWSLQAGCGCSGDFTHVSRPLCYSYTGLQGATRPRGSDPNTLVDCQTTGAHGNCYSGRVCGTIGYDVNNRRVTLQAQ
ncbi:hypothetical protein BV898_02566 [Hypsibius exemplaris]|uniref:P-type domain-containing protein n=1 Tax=Hypsibius exemplaris TaxID=2072580 RepID=A0A1W0X7Q3_HYPEX|nr:hypothetical protein BV898_02566 [Hypsibius exemplaris]